MNAAGLTTCVRYSHPPNWLHYCGPERQSDVRLYTETGAPDSGLADILSRFETLYPYLVLIASENRIRDPFDPRVVEAYWIGNRLLNAAKYRPLERHLTDTLDLKRKLTRPQLSRTLSLLDDAVPHHNFHVLNIFRRTGHHAAPHTLPTMDACRISWGRVVSVGDGRTVVATRPLVYAGEALSLGPTVTKTVSDVAGLAKPGDTVTLHWGVVCEPVNRRQVAALRKYTDVAIRLANTQV